MLAAVGTFAGLCSAVVIQQGLRLQSSSPLLWGVATGGVLAGLVAEILALRVSDSTIEAWRLRGADFLTRTHVSPATNPSRRAGFGLVVFGGLLFSINTTWVVRHQDTPDDDDQQAYLITAGEIHDRGGLLTLWSDLWTGRFEESNRHPLLLAILSLNPTEKFGRAVSIALASVTLILTLILVWRRMGPLTAGLFSVLLGTNGAWLYHAPRIVCESLLTGLAGLLWLSLWSPSEPEDIHARSALPGRQALLAGLLCGLVYLTKGTGILLFAGIGIAYVTFAIGGTGDRAGPPATPHQSRWPGLLSLALFALTFAVVASPLLVRNTIRFGSPTYNINAYLFWVDAYESPNAMADRITTKEARTAYLATHSLTDLVQREATGLAWEAFIGLRTLGPAPLDDARVLCGAPLCAFGLLGLCHSPRFPAWVLTLWTGIVWGAMAWYVPIAAGDRFVMPLLIPWLTLAADGLARIPHATSDPPSTVRRIVWATSLWGVISTALVWTRSELWAG